MSGPQQKKPQLTHFLCIPLATGGTSRPQLSRTLASFRDDVTRLKDLGGFELPRDAVRPVGTLHLTLGMMSFPRGEGLDRAVELLRSLRLREILSTVERPVMPGSSSLGGTEAGKTAAADPVADADQQQEPQQEGIAITLKGLHSMQKVDKATVLYAPPVDPHGILHGFGDRIKTRFKEAGLLAPNDLPLLLHATIVNTVYVKGRGKQQGKKKKQWDRIVINDAQAVMDRYEDQVWMENVPLDRIAICRMSAKPIEKDGVVVDAAYEVEAEIGF